MKTMIHRLLVLCVVLLMGCGKDTPGPTPAVDYGSGIYMVNEGPFAQGTGSITYRSRDGMTLVQDVFGTVNGRPLGNIAQRMGIWGTTGLIVVNNAGKVEWVNRADFRSMGTTTGLELPSALLIDSSRGLAYVTEWVNFTDHGRVALIDLNSRQIIQRFEVGHFPNALALQGNRLLVANGDENTLSEIDLDNRSVLGTINVGDRPHSFVRRGNELWLLCGGTPSWAGVETPGSLWQIAPAPVLAYNLPSATQHPADLCLHPDGQRFFARLDGGLSLLIPNDATNRTDVQSVTTRSLYHVSVDPFDLRGRIYGTDAGNFQSNGMVYVYDPSFVVIDSFMAGVGPGFIAYSR
jgi:YVTN family beta-propeller protein